MQVGRALCRAPLKDDSRGKTINDNYLSLFVHITRQHEKESIEKSECFEYTPHYYSPVCLQALNFLNNTALYGLQ